VVLVPDLVAASPEHRHRAHAVLDSLHQAQEHLPRWFGGRVGG
jgi:hypothetical protein